ncbi:hypothetical protein ACFL5F_06800 [Planctomycetota bacterium]
MSKIISNGIVFLVLFSAQVVFGAEEIPALGEQDMSSVTDDQGVTHNWGYIWTHIFDYGADDGEGFNFGYDADGSTHGVTYSQQDKDGKGITFTFSRSEDIELRGHTTRPDIASWSTAGDVNIDMYRHDAELGWHEPCLEDKFSGFSVYYGVKFAEINKDFHLDNRPLMKQKTWYLGPYIAIGGNHPLGSDESKLSMFWTGQFSILYIEKGLGSDNTWAGVPGMEPDTGNVYGIGGNATVGLSYGFFDNAWIRGGYRGQALNGSDFEDSYQAWIAQAVFRF